MNIPSNITAHLDKEQHMFFQSFFKNCPPALIDRMMLKSFPPKHTLIHTDDPCSSVYILLSGRLQAIEERAAEYQYAFTELTAIEILGDFELFTEEPHRILTISTLEHSTCLILPPADYVCWLKEDAAALFLRTQMLIRQMTKQTRLERQMYFMDNRTKLLYFLYYEVQRTGEYPTVISYTRTQIADKLGCSVRSINRSILSLESNHLLSLCHGKIRVTETQFHQILGIVANPFAKSASVGR